MKIVFYDTETSGLESSHHEIIQVAMVAFEAAGKDWTKIGSFERKMKFDIDKADPKALEMNCYDPEVWEREAVSQKQGLDEFNTFISNFKDVRRESKRTGKPFFCVRTGGHNVVRFDDDFVRAWYKSHGAFCPMDYAEVFDTFQLAKWEMRFRREIDTENLKLETLCKLYGIELDGAHDALNDITANARLAWAMTYGSPKQ